MKTIIPITTDYLVKNLTFELQRFARDSEAYKYRGNRRWNGSHGKAWWDGELLFEIVKFEAKVTANREEVINGNSVDSKIVSLKGDISFTLKNVINRNINKYLEAWKMEQIHVLALLVSLKTQMQLMDKKNAFLLKMYGLMKLH